MFAENQQKEQVSGNARYVRAEFFWAACAVAVLASVAAIGSWFYAPRQMADAQKEGVMAELVAAVNAGDYGRAVPELQERAEEGKPQAQALLAELYRTGRGVPRDLEEAFRWTLAAAEGSDAAAQVAVAEMYAHGYGVQQDLAKASEWTAKAEAARKEADQDSK